MKRRSRRICCLVALILFSLASCGRGPNPPSSAEPAPPVAVPADIADPSSFSYAAELGDVPFELLDRIELPGPTVHSARAGDSGIELRFGADRSYLFGDIASAQAVYEYGADAWGAARRGDYRYELSPEGDLVASVRDPGGESVGEEGYRSLWRFSPNSRIVAGPIAFSDFVFAATDHPSLIAVDRKSGILVRERPIGELLSGSLFYLAALDRLAARGADGALFVYGRPQASGAAVDPVESLLNPAPAAAGRIEERLSERLGSPDKKPTLIVFPFGPRDALLESGAALFRFETKREQRSRVYVAGAEARPALVEIFSADGEPLASNLDYVGLDSVIDFTFSADVPYFVAAAFLSDETVSATDAPRSAAPPCRLVIAPR